MDSGAKGRTSKEGASRTHVLVYPGRVPNAFSYCSSLACMAYNAQAVSEGCQFIMVRGQAQGHNVTKLVASHRALPDLLALNFSAACASAAVPALCRRVLSVASPPSFSAAL